MKIFKMSAYKKVKSFLIALQAKEKTKKNISNLETKTTMYSCRFLAL